MNFNVLRKNYEYIFLEGFRSCKDDDLTHAEVVEVTTFLRGGKPVLYLASHWLIDVRSEVFAADALNDDALRVRAVASEFAELDLLDGHAAVFCCYGARLFCCLKDVDLFHNG